MMLDTDLTSSPSLPMKTKSLSQGLVVKVNIIWAWNWLEFDVLSGYDPCIHCS